MKTVLSGLGQILFGVAGLSFFFGGRALHEFCKVDRLSAEAIGLGIAVIVGLFGILIKGFAEQMVDVGTHSREDPQAPCVLNAQLFNTSAVAGMRRHWYSQEVATKQAACREIKSKYPPRVITEDSVCKRSQTLIRSVSKKQQLCARALELQSGW